MKRTAVYVDGFNLYHSLLRGSEPVKWLDLKALANALLDNENEVVLIRYFTARVEDTDDDPRLAVRQDIYIKALQAHISELTVQFGQFKTQTKRRPLASFPNTIVEVKNREEKGSDVNLAVHLLNDAWHNRYEVALVFSNDSDLAEALHLVQALGKPVGIASSVYRPTQKLLENSDFRKRINATHLRNSQLPDEVVDCGGRRFHRPSEWA